MSYLTVFFEAVVAALLVAGTLYAATLGPAIFEEPYSPVFGDTPAGAGGEYAPAGLTIMELVE